MVASMVRTATIITLEEASMGISTRISASRDWARL